MTSSHDNSQSPPPENSDSEFEQLAGGDDTANNAFQARNPDGRKTFLEKWSTVILCVALFFMPLVLLGSIKSLKVYANDISQWLPSGFEEKQTYDDFQMRFGADEMMVLTWDECTLDNPVVTEFQNALIAHEIDGERVFDRVISGKQMLAQIESAGVTNRTARARIQGLLVGPDESTTCIIAYPQEKFFDIRRPIVDSTYKLANSQFGITYEQLRMGGPTVDGAAIEIESKKSLGTFLWMSVLMVFLLTWYRMRDLPLSILVILFSGLCAALSLTVLFWTGGRMNLTMVMLPTLTFILGVSGCVHMVNYYRKAATLGYGMRSADQAIKDGGYPVALSATTTAVGLLSLSMSHVTPIRLFGFYSACGIFASIMVILMVLPATLYLLRGRISKRFSTQGTMSRRERTSGVSRSSSLLLHWVYRSHWLVVIPALIGVTLLAMGVFKLEASVKLQNRFASRTKIISDYEWMENNLGPLVPMEIVLHFDPENGLSRWQQMMMVKSIERAVKQTTKINATLSVATFEPYIPRGNRLADKFKRKTILEKWSNEFEQFEDAKLVSVVGDESFWRISLRVAALNDIDYGDFIETVATNVNEQMEHLGQHGVTASLTGGIPLVYKAQHQILSDLTYSFVTAFLIITVIMIFVLRSFWAGLVAMIPNVFPPLVVFGGMGWLGYSIEIGSVMTASVALGIAVDDTLHFLTWYRRGTKDGLSRFSSIRFAFDHCAKAMIDTSMICGLGVMPFVFGVFMPTVKFALLLMIMLMTALLGDLILLPAILAGPAGRLFRLDSDKKVKRQQAEREAAAVRKSGGQFNHETDALDVESNPAAAATQATERLDEPQAKPISDPYSDPPAAPLKTSRRV
ncbi:MAG: putative RND superfamily exporter protein [Mariniblastus sp.]